MLTFKQLREVDNEYYKSQVTVNKSNFITEFIDEQITDMYDHNYILVEQMVNNMDDIKQYISDKMSALAKDDREGHINAVFAPAEIVQEDLDKWMKNNHFDKSYRMYMAVESSKYENMEENKECNVIKAETLDVMKEGANVIAEDDLPYTGEDFAYRKAKRKTEIYSSGHLALYVCYANDEPVGAGEWFKHGDLVKIESLVVSEQCRGKGYGTQLIRKMVADAYQSGASYVYLTTDKDDTPQHMYSKLGFNHIGEEARYMWKSSQVVPRKS